VPPMAFEGVLAKAKELHNVSNRQVRDASLGDLFTCE
jgi:hypothetical protein